MCRNGNGGSACFIFIALLVHVAAFYFIRIDTTRAELRHQTRIHVSVEYPQALAVDGAPADEFWDRLTDPRLFLLPHETARQLHRRPAGDRPQLQPRLEGSPSRRVAGRPTAPRAPPSTPLEQRVGDTMRRRASLSTTTRSRPPLPPRRRGNGTPRWPRANPRACRTCPRRSPTST